MEVTIGSYCPAKNFPITENNSRQTIKILKLPVNLTDPFLDNHTKFSKVLLCTLSSFLTEQYKMAQTKIDNLLKELNLVLPPAPKPLGVYKPCLQLGNLLYLSGHGPVQNDGSLIVGRIGEGTSVEQGKTAARQVGLTMLATIVQNIGSLHKIKRVIKVLGMVNCTPDFERHPYVINGCSELFAAIWGDENGIGVRSAVGMGSLPDNIPVEIEAIFELDV